MEKGTVSIYTIAKEAGVSAATVSRVLTGNARVSEEKRVRVQKAITKYEFKPNALARGLSTIETKMIGMMVSDIRNPFYASMAVSCEQAARERDYQVLLCNSLMDNRLEKEHLDRLAMQRVDALIQVGGKVDELVTDMSYVESINKLALTTPVVITGKLDGADCYQINIDEMQAMELILDYLISIGHQRIALVGGRGDVKSTLDKRTRYRQILKKHQIPIREHYIIDAEKYDLENGHLAGLRLLQTCSGLLPTAVIAINDFSALGVIRALQEQGFRIPEDISVASFDNTYLAETSIPTLTSVGYDYENMGRLLVETAIHAIRHEEVPLTQVVSSMLVKRNSCQPVQEETL